MLPKDRPCMPFYCEARAIKKTLLRVLAKARLAES